MESSGHRGGLNCYLISKAEDSQWADKPLTASAQTMCSTCHECAKTVSWWISGLSPTSNILTCRRLQVKEWRLIWPWGCDLTFTQWQHSRWWNDALDNYNQRPLPKSSPKDFCNPAFLVTIGFCLSLLVSPSLAVSAHAYFTVPPPPRWLRLVKTACNAGDMGSVPG